MSVDPECHPVCFHFSTLTSIANVVRMAFISLSYTLTEYLAKGKDSALQHISHFPSSLSQQSLSTVI